MSTQRFLLDSRGSTVIKVPTELLVIIFHFVGPSTPTNPYPYLPLSWVCRLWRSVVRNDSRFWTVTYMNRVSYLCPLVINEAAWHSNSRAVDLIIHRLDASEENSTHFPTWTTLSELQLELSSKSYRERIRTLLFPADIQFAIDVPPEFSFPRLEKLTVPFASSISFKNRLAALVVASPSLRYMALSCFALLDLHKQNLSHHLVHIEGLKLLGVTSLSAAYPVLESMRNLQVLIISSLYEQIRMEPSEPTPVEAIELPKLRIFSLESIIDEIWMLKAPKLDHLSILNLGRDSSNESPRTSNNWSLLESFDFSQISNVLIGLHTHASTNFNAVHFGLGSVFACITVSNRVLLDCSSFQHFHEEGFSSRPLLDDYLDLPPKNCFHIPFAWKTNAKCFRSILGRATNLVELTLHYDGMNLKDDPDYHSFMEKILDSVAGERITRLNIMQGRSFTVTACTLLGGRRAPRLERLMYHNAFMVRVTSFLPSNLKTLQSARSNAGSQPLKILELRSFSSLSAQCVQAIEDLDVQLVQMP